MPGLTQKRNSAGSEILLKSVAEELKLPLMQIVRQAELTALTETAAGEALAAVRSSAASAIELVDSYMLGLELAGRQQVMDLEPISIGSVIYDVANKLNATAKRYNVNLEIRLASACEPVMASRAGLNAAMLSLGSSFIEALPADVQNQTILLATHRTARGLAAGVYSPLTAVSAEQLHRAERLGSWMRQPLSQFSAGSAAGIFVAKAILESMSARLRTAHYHKQAGLAAILQPSYQLELV